MTEEIGRELRASELKPDTVVCVCKDGWQIHVTMWVIEVNHDRIWLHADEISWSFVGQRTGEDREELRDSEGALLHVFEYLGDI